MLRLSSPGCRLGRLQVRQERARLAAAAARERRPAAAVAADALLWAQEARRNKQVEEWLPAYHEAAALGQPVVALAFKWKI